TAFVNILANPISALGMVSKAAVEKNGQDYLELHPVGTGPFKFKEWITDDRVIMEKNPNYFEKGADGKPLPYLDGYVCRYIPDPSVALVDIRSGSADLLIQMVAKDVATVKADPNLVLFDMPWSSTIYGYGGFNTKRAPFSDVRVRQAALYAYDRAGMAKLLGFGVSEDYNYLEWTTKSLGYDNSIVKYEYNPAKAKELLAQAGFANGVDITLRIIAREPDNTVGQFMQTMWNAVGLRTKLLATERLVWIDQVAAMDFDAATWGGSTENTAVDPELLRRRYPCGAPSNFSQFCDQTVDKALNDGAGETDPKKRDAIYRTMLKAMMENAYLFSGIGIPRLMAVRKEVQGLTANVNLPDVRSVWLNK
ncbi:MAG: ABC transporter substrate-binding protein, partial [Chloroflexota bacterium]